MTGRSKQPSDELGMARALGPTMWARCTTHFDAAQYLGDKRIVAVGLDTPFVDAVADGTARGKGGSARRDATGKGAIHCPEKSSGLRKLGRHLCIRWNLMIQQ